MGIRLNENGKRVRKGLLIGGIAAITLAAYSGFKKPVEETVNDTLKTYCDIIMEGDSVYTLAERFHTSDISTIEDQLSMQGKEFEDIGELVCFILPKDREGFDVNIQLEDNEETSYDLSNFSNSVQKWDNSIIMWANNIDLPYVEEEDEPYLIATIMQIESSGNENAISKGDALGLFQVMPYHFQQGDDPFDPDTNASIGLNILRESLEQSHGNIAAALAGYNGGYWATEWFNGKISRDEYIFYTKNWIREYYKGQGVELSENEIYNMALSKASQVERYVQRGLSVYENSKVFSP